MTLDFWGWGIWTYRSVTTQANVAGGAILVDFSPAAGNTMIPSSVDAANSGTNSLFIDLKDENNSRQNRYANVASGAGTIARLPSVGDSAGTTDNAANSQFIVVRGDNYLTVFQGGAGAQNDTLTISLQAFVSSSGLPVVSKTRSTNEADVIIATPTVNKIV